MNILHNIDYLQTLSHTNLFLDTNVFIGALTQPDLGNFLFKIKSHDCELLTIPAVLTEFLRGSTNLKTYSTRTEFVENLAGIFPTDKLLEQMQDFTIVMNSTSSEADYTDFLLSACSYKFKCQNLTENHKHFPLSIFERKQIITIDTGKDIRNYGFYQISERKFNKAAESILKQK